MRATASTEPAPSSRPTAFPSHRLPVPLPFRFTAFPLQRLSTSTATGESATGCRECHSPEHAGKDSPWRCHHDADQVAASLGCRRRPVHETPTIQPITAGSTSRRDRRNILDAKLLGGELQAAKATGEHEDDGGHHGGELGRHGARFAALPAASLAVLHAVFLANRRR